MGWEEEEVGGGVGGGGRGWEGEILYACIYTRGVLYMQYTYLSTNDWLMGQYSYNSHLKSLLL